MSMRFPVPVVSPSPKAIDRADVEMLAEAFSCWLSELNSIFENRHYLDIDNGDFKESFFAFASDYFRKQKLKLRDVVFSRFWFSVQKWELGNWFRGWGKLPSTPKTDEVLDLL